MDQLLTYTEQIRSLANQHLPPEAFNVAAAVAGAAVILGIIISVAGAKLAKIAFTVGMTLAGIGAAASIVPHVTAPEWLTYVLGAAIGAVLGFLLFRLWVAGVAAAVFAVVAIAYAGHAQVLPALERMDGSPVSLAADGSPFTVPSPAEQQSFQRMTFEQFSDRFWSEVQTQDPSAPGRLRIFGAVAAIVGFIIGILLARMTLVVCTSLVGTGLLMCGLFYLTQTFWPDAIKQLAPHGRVLGLITLAFFLMSLVLQARLTQPAPKAAAPAKAPPAIPV